MDPSQSFDLPRPFISKLVCRHDGLDHENKLSSVPLIAPFGRRVLVEGFREARDVEAIRMFSLVE